MMYRNLEFQEIDEKISQAAVSLKGDYKIQIIRYDATGNHDCNLYSSQGLILDQVEGEDEEGVMDFIRISEELLVDIEFWDDAIKEECELIQTI